ncbi:MAG: dimethylmenaquinone methyltransferase [Promethearchaeota archaeon Loki_b31]|nr:MAG: dimethylmenaquinone methyltransferase [Candidatus Lokiarchaeota archaeon Loki_b31]
MIAFLCFLFIIFVIVRIIRKIYKFPIPAFATRLIDNPFRRRLIQKPELIAERMQLKPGMTVVEIGPGKGSYTKAIAKKIQPNGKVFAIDIQESIINRLKKKIKKENIQNIIPKIEDAYNLSFEDESVDRIFAITCLPEIPDPIRALREFKRILKPDGIISLSELFLDPDYPLRRTEKRWAKEAGLDFYEGFGNWFVYQLNFIKKKPSY